MIGGYCLISTTAGDKSEPLLEDLFASADALTRLIQGFVLVVIVPVAALEKPWKVITSHAVCISRISPVAFGHEVSVAAAIPSILTSILQTFDVHLSDVCNLQFCCS